MGPHLGLPVFQPDHLIQLREQVQSVGDVYKRQVPALDRGVTLWQYSESGVVDGIEGPVDLDLWFTEE